MADFNKILDAGDVDGGIINVVIEIPAGSSHKIEWNRELAVFELDRVDPQIFAKPCNYGFIPQTLDEDGDELDALILTEQPLPTGIFLKAKPRMTPSISAPVPAVMRLVSIYMLIRLQKLTALLLLMR